MKYSESNHRTLRRGIEEKQRNAVLNYIHYRIDEVRIQGFCNRERVNVMLKKESLHRQSMKVYRDS